MGDIQFPHVADDVVSCERDGQSVTMQSSMTHELNISWILISMNQIQKDNNNVNATAISQENSREDS